MPTVAELLRLGTDRLTASGSDSPRLDSELLLARILHTDRTGFAAHPETLVGDAATAAFEGDLARRELGEPVAYIRGLQASSAVWRSRPIRARSSPDPRRSRSSMSSRPRWSAACSQRRGRRGPERSGSPTSGPARGRSRSPWRSHCASGGCSRRSGSWRPTTILRPSPWLARTRSATASPIGSSSSSPTCCRWMGISSISSRPTCPTWRRGPSTVGRSPCRSSRAAHSTAGPTGSLSSASCWTGCPGCSGLTAWRCSRSGPIKAPRSPPRSGHGCPTAPANSWPTWPD